MPHCNVEINSNMGFPELITFLYTLYKECEREQLILTGFGIDRVSNQWVFFFYYDDPSKIERVFNRVFEIEKVNATQLSYQPKYKQ